MNKRFALLSNSRRPARSKNRQRWLSTEPLEVRAMMTAQHDLDDSLNAHLSIVINGQDQVLPANIGKFGTDITSFVHTSAADNRLRIGPVNGIAPSAFVTLDDFFDVWRLAAGDAGNNPVSNFDATHVYDFVADPTHPVHLYVNGVANADFENYIIEDGDDIVISYGSFVTLDPIADQTVLAGAPLQVPLDGFSSEGAALSFSISTTNPNLSATTSNVDRSLKLDITHVGSTEADTFSGSMIFQLFEDRVPTVTSKIIGLADSGFYNGSSFHRVDKDFVIQGGKGATGTTAPHAFDDELNANLQHTSVGILSMAKTSDDDSNTSEFFVTAGAPRNLDFIHSVFGRLTEGEDIRQLIANTPIKPNNDPNVKEPVTAVNITKATVFFDTQNRVLSLSALEGIAGTSDVTVTVSDGLGHTAQRTFKVTITADTNDNTPFLLQMDDVHTSMDTAVAYQIAAVDVENNPIVYANAPTSPNLTLDLNANTGAATITPKTGFVGVESIFVGVRNATSGFDTQQIPVLVAPSAPGSITLDPASDNGASNSDKITTFNNSNAANKLTFHVTGVTNGMEVSVYDGDTLIGTQIAVNGQATITTDGMSPIGPGDHLITARQTLKNQTLKIGNRDEVIDIPSNHSAGFFLKINNWTNLFSPLDVNHNGFINAVDALLVIDDINIRGARNLSTGTPAVDLVDTNIDGSVAANDVLPIIDYINTGGASQAPSPPAQAHAAANPAADAATPAIDTSVVSVGVNLLSQSTSSGASMSLAATAAPAVASQNTDAGTDAAIASIGAAAQSSHTASSSSSEATDPLNDDLYDLLAVGISTRIAN